MASPPVPFFDRIDRVRREGRYQQALELTRQLYKQDPSEKNLGLLREVSFERGEQLRAGGFVKEAATVFTNAADMGGPPEFKARLQEKLLACGVVDKAVHLAETIKDPQALSRAMNVAADQALLQGKRTFLPANLQPEFDAVIQAFAHAEAGRDDQARSSLQTIGLSSPFMEWRILLRGLLAYYAQDDLRALENWQWLCPDRLPARIAAPLRFSIDPAYRTAQGPEAQNLLRHQLDRFQGLAVLPGLRTIQSLLTQKGKMGQAFRQLEGLLPNIKQQFPDLVPRLAECFYWAVIDVGDPEDLDRYMRVFGPRPGDPRLTRMAALAMERNGAFEDAHKAWQDFEKELAANPSAWPGDQLRRARALIWVHLGNMAAENSDDLLDVPFLPFPEPKQPQRFKPSAEACFRKSLELAPENLTTHELLYKFLFLQQKVEPAVKAASALLERFPENGDALQFLAGVFIQEDRLEEARDHLQRALQVNPLATELRMQLGKVHEFLAREHACAKRFDEARAACRMAQSLIDMGGVVHFSCLAAIIELKAKNQQGFADHVATAENAAGKMRLPVVYGLMCESIRLKLTPAQKKPFAQEFQAGLAGTIDPASIPPLIAMLSLQRATPAPYTGQKTHEKKLVALLDKAPLKEYPEEHLESLCDILQELEAGAVLKRFVLKARKRFPDNPTFLLAEVERYLSQQNSNGYRVRGLLEKARKLIEALPRGPRQQKLQQDLEKLEDFLRDDGGFQGFLHNLMGGMFDGEDDDDDDY